MNIFITGISSGIGEALAIALADSGHFIMGTYHTERSTKLNDHLVDQVCIDFRDRHYQSWLPDLKNIDILINCAGINYINWLQDTPEVMWDDVMAVNAKSIFILAKKYANDLIANEGTILNIISNASHMPMTNSIAYNASKGAAHIMTLQLARELGPKGVTVFGISPNRVGDTEMSKYIDSQVCGLRGWTEEEARQYQLSALPAGEETDKTTLANFIAHLLSSKKNHKYLAGTVLPYGK